MSDSFLDSLPEDLRATVLEVAMESIIEFEYPYAAAAAEQSIQVMVDGGCNVYMSDEIPELQAELEEQYAANLDLYMENAGEDGQTMYDAFQKLLAEYNAG